MSSNHPVGKNNLISIDRAVLNGILSLLFILSIGFALIMDENAYAAITAGLYLIQLLEAFFS